MNFILILFANSIVRYLSHTYIQIICYACKAVMFWINRSRWTSTQANVMMQLLSSFAFT